MGFSSSSNYLCGHSIKFERKFPSLFIKASAFFKKRVILNKALIEKKTFITQITNDDA